MPGEKQAAAGSASPAKHDEAACEKERSRSRTEKHRRTKSKSRERRMRGSSERRESKRHRSSRKHSRSASPSRSQTRGKRAFLTRQYSPPRKRHKHSRSRSDSPAVPPGTHGPGRSRSPADFGPARPLHLGRGPAPFTARWQPREFEGPMHREPPAYNGFGQPELPYGGPPPPRRWPPGHPSRFGGRSERRSPPPHWSGPVNPTTGSPIYDSSLDDRPLGGWDTAALPQQGSSQWGTSSGWARVGNESGPLSPAPGLRHSPISPPHEGREMVKVASTISPQLGLDRTPLPHSPMSPAPEKAGYPDQKPAGSPFSAIAAQQQQHWSQKVQARDRPTQAGHTATDKAAQGAGGKNAGPALHDKDKLAPLFEASGGQAAQQVQEPVTAISPATLQQALATEPGSVSQGSQHAKAVSPETDASQQAAGQVAKRAEERLRELLMDSDYNEKNWCYVDPQGVTQGPCSITEFRGWMQALRSNTQLSLQYKQFSEVVAWRKDAEFSVRMTALLNTVTQLSPSPPSSPNPRDTKLSDDGAVV